MLLNNLNGRVNKMETNPDLGQENSSHPPPPPSAQYFPDFHDRRVLDNISNIFQKDFATIKKCTCYLQYSTVQKAASKLVGRKT